MSETCGKTSQLGAHSGIPLNETAFKTFQSLADTTKWQHAATKQYPECGGETQSPLDIQTADLVNDMEPGMHLKPVVLSAEYKKATTGSLSNNGHTGESYMHGSSWLVLKVKAFGFS